MAIKPSSTNVVLLNKEQSLCLVAKSGGGSVTCDEAGYITSWTNCILTIGGYPEGAASHWPYNRNSPVAERLHPPLDSIYSS